MNQLIEKKETSLALIDDEYQSYLDRISEKKKNQIVRKVTRYVAGVDSAAPLLCRGPHRCQIIDFCPIPDRSDGDTKLGDLTDYPIGNQCVFEKLFMVERVNQLIQHLGVKLEDPVEMSIVQELAVIDLYKNRAQIFLSKGDIEGAGVDFLKTDITGFDDLGNKATSTKLHPIVDMIDKLEKRRAGWLDKLNATRQAKERHKHTSEGSQIVDELVKLRKALTNVSNLDEAEEVTFGMSD